MEFQDFNWSYTLSTQYASIDHLFYVVYEFFLGTVHEINFTLFLSTCFVEPILFLFLLFFFSITLESQ